MTHTQKLETITKELQNFSRSYFHQNEVSLSREFEEAANATNHLLKVYNYGWEGNEVDILNKYVSQKLSSLYRVVKVKSSERKDDTTIYVLGSLNNYSTIIKTTNS